MNMLNKMDQPYDQVIAMVNRSLAEIPGKATVNGNFDLTAAIDHSRALLETFRDKTVEDVSELRELSEWNTFTIALYGETNAGKSTLIETLRIQLGHSEKLATQEKFNALIKDLPIDPNDLVALGPTIQTLEAKLADGQTQVQILEKGWQDEESMFNKKAEALGTLAKQKRQGFTVWQRFVFLFKKLEEEKMLLALRAKLGEMQASNDARRKAAADNVQKVSDELDRLRADQAEIEKSLERLEPLQDGRIIGNGRSDFTLQSHAYHFVIDGQQFQLIDVPGIEGDEAQVMSAIDASVKKAHAIFYVTRAATPPGSGSEGQEGTIDKIKRQLGKQTEVWAIFNKSATAPQILQGTTLANKNDLIGLGDLDKSLGATLGDVYKGHLCVSGMPAFLASATCLLPNNPHTKSRQKFLSEMSADDILDRSGMHAFLQFIRGDICRDFRRKIVDANKKKIASCLQEGIDLLLQVRDSFAQAAKKLKVQYKSSAAQVDDLLSGTQRRLESECNDALDQKKSSMRMAVYNYIATDKSNDDFKAHLTATLQELKETVGPDLEGRFQKVFESFKNDAEDIVRQNQKNVDEILRYTINDPFSALNLSFDTKFEMDNGINMLGLLSTFGGTVALVWASFLASNPAGWTVAAVLGAMGLVFSFYKAVRSFFSSDYKMAQQRKSADENLDKVFKKLAEMLKQNIDSAKTQISGALDEAKKQMNIPYEQSDGTRKALERIAADMKALRDKVGKASAFDTAAVLENAA
ncbi:hypothetical protein [Achromobacter xylosoxidans]|uniref:hypothetical protein n=1 Tax=Alcaligenes xylosoxydans xylosoxydans TaxID=85698 RepID=UPI0004ACB583|nr:hypothetical protein [Achromobacter xylosoxidans]MCH4592333.1 hypothetical protein [Achromobacter xylosoxidans]CUI85603.1 Predicted GTPase [Achromobacter xylosoxidans]